MSVAADQSWSVISARRFSKSARLMRRTSRSVVAVLDDEMLRHVFEVREVLDGLAARQATA